MKIKFQVNKQHLQREDDQILASFSKNMLQCVFIFDDTWIDIYKYALFTEPSKKQTIIKMGIEQHTKCTIPENVLKNNFFSVSVFGGDRLTTTQETILLQPSGFNEKLEEAFSNGFVTSDSSTDSIGEYFKSYRDCCGYGYRRNLFEQQEHPYF